ncbi:MAG: hypothetical protein AABX33_08900 [Nanoarchaeota archaeon]
MMTRSVAAFNCKSLGIPIDLVRPEDDPDTSWDGCLVDKSRIVSRGVNDDIGSNIDNTEPTRKSFIFLALLIVAAIVVALYFIVHRKNKTKAN